MADVSPKPVPWAIQMLHGLVADQVPSRLGADAMSLACVLIERLDTRVSKSIGYYTPQLAELLGDNNKNPRRTRAARAALIADGWLICDTPRNGDRTETVYRMVDKTTPVKSVGGKQATRNKTVSGTHENTDFSIQTSTAGLGEMAFLPEHSTPYENDGGTKQPPSNQRGYPRQIGSATPGKSVALPIPSIPKEKKPSNEGSQMPISDSDSKTEFQKAQENYKRQNIDHDETPSRAQMAISVSPMVDAHLRKLQSRKAGA